MFFPPGNLGKLHSPVYTVARVIVPKPAQKPQAQGLLTVCGHSISEDLRKAVVSFLEKHTEICMQFCKNLQLQRVVAVAHLPLWWPPMALDKTCPLSWLSRPPTHPFLLRLLTAPATLLSFPRPKHTLYFPTFEPGVRGPEVPLRRPGGQKLLLHVYPAQPGPPEAEKQPQPVLRHRPAPPTWLGSAISVSWPL